GRSASEVSLVLLPTNRSAAVSEGPAVACRNWIGVFSTRNVMGTRCDWPFRHSRAPPRADPSWFMVPMRVQSWRLRLPMHLRRAQSGLLPPWSGSRAATLSTCIVASFTARILGVQHQRCLGPAHTGQARAAFGRSVEVFGITHFAGFDRH